MITTSSTIALAAIVALGLGCTACSSGGTYGGASPADARVAVPATAPATPAAAPARAYQPPPSYDSGPGGGYRRQRHGRERGQLLAARRVTVITARGATLRHRFWRCRRRS